jgi:alpha-beta hydrolase superfamily lysophospholipase
VIAVLLPQEATVPKPESAATELTFVDAHGVTVHYYVWQANQPKAVVQLAHGLGEYASRYEHLGSSLAAAGISVYAADNRGHGKTGLGQTKGDHSKLGKLGVGGLRAAIGDLHQLTEIVKHDHPGLPVAFLGHSMGSLIGQKLVHAYPKDFDAVIFTGTAYRVPGQMNAGDLNAKHKHLGSTGSEWLSRDAAVAEAFQSDPLTFYADTLKLFGLADGLRLFGRPGKNLPKDFPLLIMIGSEDPVGGEVSVRKLAESYVSRSGLTDVEVVVYAGARHEVFNETNKDEVVNDLIAWLRARLGITK